MKKLSLALLLCACATPNIRPTTVVTEPVKPKLIGNIVSLSDMDTYIVTFAEGTLLSEIQRITGELASNETDVVRQVNQAILSFSAFMDKKTVRKLLKHPDVLYVEQDQIATTQEVYPNPPNGLDRIDQRIGRDKSYDDRGRTASAVHVYVLDTGIRKSHSEWNLNGASRVGVGFDFIDNDDDPEDCHGHGTHVSSTILGTKYGIAKNAILHGMRVLGCGGSGSYSGIIAAIDWVTANRDPNAPAVVNMSLGGRASPSLNEAVKRSSATGVHYVVAAGNNNANACNYSPASAPEAFTVGALNSTSDARATFSNWGNCLDLFAPGVSILGAWHTSDTATRTISGTSMASPHVAGLVAQFLEVVPHSTPENTETELEEILTQDCVKSPGAGSPNLIAYNDLLAQDPGPHCRSEEPVSCKGTGSCGGKAPGGCYCDFFCPIMGDCCSDGPCYP